VRVDGYELVERINRGRELDVYEAWSDDRGCHCIVKTLRPEARDDAAARRRLRAEGRLLLSLTHPHIARAYELLTVDGAPVLVLETLGGATLSWMVRESGRRLTSDDLCHLGLQLCSAIGYLHRRDRLHLDLKPSNVISEGGIARVIDLNLARRAGRVPAGYGTAQYLAPEQLERRAQPIRRLRRSLPKPLADVVDACLEPAPRDRPALDDLEAELDALV
jgi:serine/threonine protein kinase